MDLLATAKKLVTEMNTGYSYARKFLISNTVNVFLQREKKSDGSRENLNETDFIADSSIEDDVFGTLEVQTRYSALVTDIMSPNPEISDVLNVLDLLITLNEKLSTTQHKARTWQQIARVFAYEIRMKKIPNEANEHVTRTYKLVCPGSKTNEVPTNGFDIAHLGIDQAIKLQESYAHHLVTKGAFFMAKLGDLREAVKLFTSENEELKAFVQEAIDTCKNAIDAYEAALKKTFPDGYLYAMVGKIQTLIFLLEILKSLPVFALHNEGPDQSFKDYMTFGNQLVDLETTFSQDDLNYFNSLRKMPVQLSNDLFREIKIRQTQSYQAHEIQELTNARIRALKLRKSFYKVSGLDRTHLADETGYKEDIVLDLLFQHNETPYSGWRELQQPVISRIFETLKKAIPWETTSHDAMLVYARAALQMKVSVDDLSRHTKLWCQKFPRSVWANLFNYMIHFPVPNGSLKADVATVKSSIAMCKSISYSRQGYRKSGAEYFLGKSVGLNSIIPSHEVSPNSMEVKTEFWRSDDVCKKLERLQGQKSLDRKGVLTYKGIEIMFNNERYPKESRDDLWFCLGFTVNGPYAYDPIADDAYHQIKKKCSFQERKQKDAAPPSTSAHDAQRSPATSKSLLKTTSPPVQFDITGAKAKSQPTSNAIRSTKEVKHSTVVRPEESWRGNPRLVIRKRSPEGHQITFPPKWIDRYGRIHHGAYVKRAPKSSECRTHTRDPVPESCRFAHSWKGDHSAQTVCQLCTKNDCQNCDDRKKHCKYILNLGPYLNEKGETWKPQTQDPTIRTNSGSTTTVNNTDLHKNRVSQTYKETQERRREVGTGRKIGDLNAGVFQDVCRMLDRPIKDRDWRTLAGKMGYTSNHVKDLECTGNPADAMLSSWGTKSGNDVAKLIELLKVMERDDVVEVLEKEQS